MADEARKARLAALAAKAADAVNTTAILKQINNIDADNDEMYPVIEDRMLVDNVAPNTSNRYIKFRNYTPESKELIVSSEHCTTSVNKLRVPDEIEDQNKNIGKKRPAEGGDRIDNEEMDESHTTPSLEEALLNARRELLSSKLNMKAAEISSLAPRKVNWDLKRDIQPKLDKLERRTQRAIVELLHQRLEREAAHATDTEDDDLD
jgi:coiled-coil domain-containing protein 12